MADIRTTKPFAIVFGATGLQGGSVVNALIADGTYHVRGVTRDLDSPKAKELAFRGVELIKADQHDFESLKKAVKGADAVFAVTDYWHDPDNEIENGKRMAKAAKEEGVRIYVWSTLPDSAKISHGKYNLLRFSNKAKVNEYIKSLSFPHYAFVQVGFYMQNFRNYQMAVRDLDKVIYFKLPLGPSNVLDSVNVEDTGKVVAVIMKQPEQYADGAVFNVVGSHDYMGILIDAFIATTGQQAVLKEIPLDEYRASMGKELADMFAYFKEVGFGGPGVDYTSGRRLAKDILNWKEYLQKVGWASAVHVELPRQLDAGGTLETEDEEARNPPAGT